MGDKVLITVKSALAKAFHKKKYKIASIFCVTVCCERQKKIKKNYDEHGMSRTFTI
jgi:hypothetical protein